MTPPVDFTVTRTISSLRVALQRRDTALLLWGGLLFVASALFHVGVWMVDGLPPLDGPTGWRKPIAFGASIGVLLWSLAWAISLLPASRRLTGQAGAVVGLLVAELTLIDVQAWRGVPSHFNQSSALDGAIFTAMGIVIMAVSVILAIWTFALFRVGQGPRPRLFIARAAMVMLNAGNLAGMVMAAVNSNTIGEAGQMKLAHAVALHAIQVLPLALWIIGPRLAALRSVAIGCGALFAFTFLQAVAGRAPLDVTPLSMAVPAVAVMMMAVPVAGAILRRCAVLDSSRSLSALLSASMPRHRFASKP